MLQITPIPTNPGDLLSLLGADLTTSHRLFIYDSRKPNGAPNICADMTLEQFFTGVNTLVNAGTIVGPTTNSSETLAATGGGASISADSSFVTVTSADANNIIILPAPVVGKRIVLQNGATGYELRTSSPTTIAINGGTGAGAESAIAASTTVYITCTSATTWKGFQQVANGDISKVEVAA